MHISLQPQRHQYWQRGHWNRPTGPAMVTRPPTNFVYFIRLMEALTMFQQAWGSNGFHQPQSSHPHQMQQYPSSNGQPQPVAAQRTSVRGGGGSRQLADGTFVDPLGRPGKPFFNKKTGDLVWVKPDFKQLQSYEKESKRILRTWDMNNLPGEPIYGSGEGYVEWAEKYFPGGFNQYRHNRSNRATGVEDHNQLRNLLARSRGVKPEEIDYREVVVLYGLGEHGQQTKAQAVQKIWDKNPPGDPLNPQKGFEVWGKESWESFWQAAPNQKPKNWVWPDDWKPTRSAPK